jgi:hypothetical protein
MMNDKLVNKVANSGLITLDLANYLPQEEIVTFDLKDHLFMGLILKEKDFREALKNLDWSGFQNKYVAIVCSVDAIIPAWAFMLIVSYLQPIVKDVMVGNEAELQRHLFLKNIDAIDVSQFAGQRVVIKGCGDMNIESFAYAEITKVLLPVVKSIMYGEPCSTVPVYKKTTSLNP